MSTQQLIDENNALIAERERLRAAILEATNAG